MKETYVHSKNGRQDPAILASQRRCQDQLYGPSENAPLTLLSQAALASAVKKEHTLLNYAVATVENTFELIEGSGSGAGVVGKDGTILFSRADPDLVDPNGQAILQPGTLWGEETAGTNAIGISLIEQTSVCVQPEEHHLTWLRSYATCAAPILSPQAEFIGALTVITKSESTQLHTLGFIRTAAILVENRMLIGSMADKTVLLFHSEPHNIGTIKQCIVAFDEQGKLVGTNSAARNYLGLNQASSVTIALQDLFSLSLDELNTLKNTNLPAQLTLSLLDGRQVWTALKKHTSNGHIADFRASTGTTSEQLDATLQRATRTATTELTLHDLDLGDPQVRRAIQKAQRVIGLDLPLMIEGESGVGKEVFTRAFHNSGTRKQGPFVAINCAAIPESLIESELFGYEEGAFTGAKRRGSTGKFLQANGGTLFLDEIGDMPLQLQGRLLRVLQERQVDRLGSDKTIPVDFSLVCATHRNLRQEILEGRFREDLYYRLNGMSVVLPPLRERRDLMQLAHVIAQREEGGQKIEISSEVIEVFQHAQWPGNIRQMQTLIRIAIALARPENVIQLEHLPEEFLSDLSRFNQGQVQPETGSVGITQLPPSGRLADLEILMIKQTLASTKGNVSEAARLLGISRKTIYRKWEKISETTDSQ